MVCPSLQLYLYYLFSLSDIRVFPGTSSEVTWIWHLRSYWLDANQRKCYSSSCSLCACLDLGFLQCFIYNKIYCKKKKKKKGKWKIGKLLINITLSQYITLKIYCKNQQEDSVYKMVCYPDWWRQFDPSDTLDGRREPACASCFQTYTQMFWLVGAITYKVLNN